MAIPEIEDQLGGSAADIAAIERAVLDYMDGWFTADAGRMRRALHPDLAKRCLCYEAASGEPNGEFYRSKAEQLVRQTAEGGEKKWSDAKYDPDLGPKNFDVKVFEIFGDVASARIWSQAYVEYMHLGKFGEAGWKIVNILYGHAQGPAPINEWKKTDFEYWMP